MWPDHWSKMESIHRKGYYVGYGQARRNSVLATWGLNEKGNWEPCLIYLFTSFQPLQTNQRPDYPRQFLASATLLPHPPGDLTFHAHAPLLLVIQLGTRGEGPWLQQYAMPCCKRQQMDDFNEEQLASLCLEERKYLVQIFSTNQCLLGGCKLGRW